MPIPTASRASRRAVTSVASTIDLKWKRGDLFCGNVAAMKPWADDPHLDYPSSDWVPQVRSAAADRTWERGVHPFVIPTSHIPGLKGEIWGTHFSFSSQTWSTHPCYSDGAGLPGNWSAGSLGFLMDSSCLKFCEKTATPSVPTNNPPTFLKSQSPLRAKL